MLKSRLLPSDLVAQSVERPRSNPKVVGSIPTLVKVSPTDGNGPTQGQRKTLTRVGIEPTTFGLDLRRSTD